MSPRSIYETDEAPILFVAFACLLASGVVIGVGQEAGLTHGRLAISFIAALALMVIAIHLVDAAFRAALKKGMK